MMIVRVALAGVICAAAWWLDSIGFLAVAVWLNYVAIEGVNTDAALRENPPPQ